MTLHVIVIAYERPIHTRILIDCFLVQTDPRWKMTVVHDGPASDEMKKVLALYDDPRISFISTETREGNWGHANRRMMLQLINGDSGDFVLITNNDNYYVPFFVKLMLEEAKPDVSLIYCDFLHHNYHFDIVISRLKQNFIDMGAFIVEIKLAQSVGFIHDVPASDGLFAEECAARCMELRLKTVHIPKVLFSHN